MFFGVRPIELLDKPKKKKVALNIFFFYFAHYSQFEFTGLLFLNCIKELKNNPNFHPLKNVIVLKKNVIIKVIFRFRPHVVTQEMTFSFTALAERKKYIMLTALVKLSHSTPLFMKDNILCSLKLHLFEQKVKINITMKYCKIYSSVSLLPTSLILETRDNIFII